MADTRISQTTVANEAENARLASIQPAAGGWAPASWMPLLVAVITGSLTAVGALITSGSALTVATVVGAIVAGAATALGGFFGVKSAGPRTPPTVIIPPPPRGPES